MKIVFRYKSGYTIRKGKNWLYYIYKGRQCEAWKMDTIKQAHEMHKYLIN